MKQLLFVLLLWTKIAHAQQLPNTILSVEDVETGSKATLPFGFVQVLDVRFDQSNIGCVNKISSANQSRVRFKQATISFPDSLHQYFPQLLQKLFTLDHNSNDTLVLLVKQFRISERLINNINLQFEPELILRLSLSAFRLKNGQLCRLFSLDDLFSQRLPYDRIPKEQVMDEYRKDGLVLLLQNILRTKPWNSTTAAIFAMPIVQQGLQKRFQLPLLTDSVLKPGVYLTFQEFKQNSPSLTNVHLGIRKDKVVSIKDSAGKPLDLSKVWGVCSGKKSFIVFRGVLCELVPSDKSFFFLSYIQPSDLSGLPSFGDHAAQMGLLAAALQKSFDNRNIPHFFFLNMDEETVYLEDVFGKSSLKQLEKELLK